MIRLTYSNRTEALLEALARRLDARRKSADPLAPIEIVVPNRNVERFVELGVARALGIAANLRFSRLEGLVRRWLEPGAPLLVEGALAACVLRALLDETLLEREVMAPVRRYLSGAGEAADAVDLRRAQLALHLARLFEEYGFSRPELLAAWDASRALHAGTPRAANEAWQAELWRALRAHRPDHRTLAEALDASAALPPPAPELHVFGLSYVARIFSRVYAELGARSELYLYTLNPCEEFWEDVETAAELRSRRRRSDAEPDWLLTDEDPFRLSVDTETPLLRLWGRPGREHVRMLGALTECDFEAAFVDPQRAPERTAASALPLFASLDAPPLLARLQHDVLARAPRTARADASAPRDPSVQILACPSVRREVETVAAEIWSLVGGELEGLTFDRVAVLVNGPDRDLYLPHLAAVFEEAHGIPYNVADLSLSSTSPLALGALRLLALPGSRFTRPDVLGVITHPAVRPPDVEPHAWVSLCDRLGVFHGLDHEAHRGTYIAEDLLNWEQGLVRVALGAFVAGEASGDPRFVHVGDARYLPEEPLGSEAGAARFVQLCRSLLSDARFARSARLSLGAWSRFFAAMVRTYLSPADEREGSALRSVLASIAGLAELDVDETPVSYTVAHELAREALEALGSGRGQQLADGVAISSLVPMRAIPFRVIFVLGLGEGRFPAPDRRDTMDLRAARRQVGDVTPPERDRYTFLETLLSARDRLYLSYVARDEQTGDELEPSTVVSELLDAIDAGHLPDAKNRIVRTPALRRHKEPSIALVLPEASAERRAVELGHALAAELPLEAVNELARPEALRRVARLEPLARALALAPLPERAPSADPNRTLRLSLAALRRFLECPLQAWTRAVLRLEEDEPDTAFAIADEPFAPSPLETAVALRASFALHALHGTELAEAYAAEVEPRKARGRWPIGAIEGLAAREHREVLERWRAAYATLGPARASIVRFGSASSGEASVEVLDPIELLFEDDPRAPGSGRPLRVELVGRTDLVREDPRSSVLPLLRESRGSRGRVTALRYALRAFVDHAALSASGREAPLHRAVQLYGDREDARPSVIGFAGLSVAEARSWLSSLARDLIARRHAYLLPCEAVLRLADRWDQVDGAELVRSVEEVRDRWGGGQSRFGPVREPLRYPPLAPGDAEEVAERRFGPFLRSFRPG